MTQQQNKIGVLLPQSKQFKSIDKDFIRGLKMNLPNTKLFIESISIAADYLLILDKIKKLHFQDDINVIVGILGHHNISEIYEYAHHNDIILIATDLGASPPFNQRKFDSVFINSYSIIESFYLLGKHLKDKNINSIASSTSYYDCGYGILAALEASCYDNDIQIEGHYITPFQPREDESKIMNDLISQYNPDAVVAFHSGLFTNEHATFVNESNSLKKYPYYLSSFTYDESLTDILETVFVVASWIENTENCVFTETYKEQFDINPSIFSLLGYETSLVLSNCIDESSKKTVDNIKNISINGPRGTIKFDHETNRTNYNHHIYRLQKESKLFKIESILENNGEFIKTIIKTDVTVESGGWQNAYLCH